MGFLLSGEGAGKHDLRVVVGWSFLFQVFSKIAACVNLGVTLKGLRRVENVAVAVEESCVLDVKSGTVLVISSSRILVFNCCLKARYLFCKVSLSFSIVPKIVSTKQVIHVALYFLHSWKKWERRKILQF